MKVENVNPYAGDTREKGKQVRDMFNAIAPAYDFMNRAMTFGLDRLWLRRLVKAVSATGAEAIVDLATGTGDVALALARKMPSARIHGMDLSEGMLEKAREKAANSECGSRLSFEQADCLSTGLDDECAQAVTVAYGVRNFADIAAGYREMHRILKPGGTLAVLELSRPANALVKPLYTIYTRLLIPTAGRIVAGDGDAYRYLLQSIAAAPQRDAMTRLMTEAGFSKASYHSLFFGVCTLYTAVK